MLNEQLGRHIYRGREGKKECVLCGDECESVNHVHCGIVQHIEVLELNFC